MRRAYFRFIKWADTFGHDHGWCPRPVCDLFEISMIGWHDWKYNRRLTKERAA